MICHQKMWHFNSPRQRMCPPEGRIVRSIFLAVGPIPAAHCLYLMVWRTRSGQPPRAGTLPIQRVGYERTDNARGVLQPCNGRALRI